MSQESAADAREELNAAIARMDNIYPWWSTFKLPFLLMAGALFGMMITSLVSVRIIQHGNDERALRDSKVACADLYRNRIADAQAALFDPWVGMDAGFLDGLLSLGDPAQTPPVPVDRVALRNLIVDSRAASAGLRQANAERNQWVADGSPSGKECPIAQIGG